VSNVFHSCPQVQNHLSSLRGERAADARRLRLARLLIVLKLALWNNGGSISRWTHLSGSLNSLFFGKAAPIPPDHAHFFPTQTCVLDRHAEERVFVLWGYIVGHGSKDDQSIPCWNFSSGSKTFLNVNANSVAPYLSRCAKRFFASSIPGL